MTVFLSQTMKKRLRVYMKGQGQESHTELSFHPGRSDFNYDRGLPPAAHGLSWDQYPSKLPYAYKTPDGLPSFSVLLWWLP